MTQEADRARERLLSAWLRANPNQPMREAMTECRLAIEAIEAEARGEDARLDVERLARAMKAAVDMGPMDTGKWVGYSERIAAKYTALARAEERTPIADGPDPASEYGRLMAERDRLIASGVDPADLDLPMQP